MDSKDIDKLLACRAIADKHINRDRSKDRLPTYKNLRKASTLEMLAGLKEHGFESFSLFDDFNRRMNFDAFMECYPLLGYCDYCEGIEEADVLCNIAFGDGSCRSQRLPDQGVNDTVIAIFLTEFNKGRVFEKDGFLYLSRFCPKGHGFYVDIATIKTPFPFDVAWGMP